MTGGHRSRPYTNYIDMTVFGLLLMFSFQVATGDFCPGPRRDASITFRHGARKRSVQR